MKISCLAGRGLVSYIVGHSPGRPRRNAAACVRRSSAAQGHEGSLHTRVRVPAGRGAVGSVWSWADAVSWPPQPWAS